MFNDWRSSSELIFVLILSDSPFWTFLTQSFSSIRIFPKATKSIPLSLTFNAPKEAFNNPDEYLFQGKSVDDLFFPQHMCFRFFGMRKIPTFVCYDVMKNPQVESDFIRLENHLKEYF